MALINAGTRVRATGLMQTVKQSTGDSRQVVLSRLHNRTRFHTHSARRVYDNTTLVTEHDVTVCATVFGSRLLVSGKLLQLPSAVAKGSLSCQVGAVLCFG